MASATMLPAMQQYETFELRLAGGPSGSDVRATFDLDGRRTETKGFRAGDGAWVVRYLPLAAGTCHYAVSGAVEAEGTVACAAAAPGRHGPVRAVGTHFAYDDGTLFRPFGTTVYALIHQDEALIDRTLATLAAAPFNKVRMCVFPKSFVYNANEPPFFAFARDAGGAFDFDRPDPMFWDALERRIRQLDALGFECDLILFHPYDRWGFAHMTQDQALAYVDHLTRRLSAFPNVWWSLANEYDLLDDFTNARWAAIEEALAAGDPVGHLLSNHNFVRYWDFADPHATHACLQSADMESAPALMRRFGKPVVFDEFGYEGNIPHSWGNLSAFAQVDRFWKACVLGAYATHGETFADPDDVLWWAKGGVLKGESPARIAFLRSLIDSLPGLLEPMPAFLADEEDPRAAVQATLDRGESAPGVPDAAFLRHLLTMSDDEIAKLARFFRTLCGHVGNRAYLRYFSRECTAVGTLDLPEDGNYSVEVIDVWAMTRSTVRTDARGRVEIPLPGREGFALLALRNDDPATVSPGPARADLKR